MKTRLKILVTGSNGFIGGKIVDALAAADHEVVRLQRRREPGVTQCDLLNSEETETVLGELDAVDALVHTAAMAHGQRPPKGYDADSVNVQMTENLINGIQGTAVGKVVFLSSVSVYGLASFSYPVALRKNPEPVTKYGKGKLACEKLFFSDSFKEAHTLRLPPVYDESHLADIRKRVVFPGTRKIKMRIFPPPKYSLLHVSNLVDYVSNLMTLGNDGHWLHHLSDPTPYSQRKVSEWFDGIHLTVPVFLTRPFYATTGLLPSRMKQRLRESYAKLFQTTVFKSGKIRIDEE